MKICVLLSLLLFCLNCFALNGDHNSKRRKAGEPFIKGSAPPGQQSCQKSASNTTNFDCSSLKSAAACGATQECVWQ